MTNVLRILIFLVALSVAMCVCAPVSRAVETVNYTVYAWVRDSISTSSNGPLYVDSTPLTGSMARVRKAASSAGYVVVIPPNPVSGYLIIAGYGIASQVSNTSTSWHSTTSYAVYSPSYSGFSSSLDSLSVGSNEFSGIVYVPAHSSTLYLWVSASPSISGAYGAYRLSSAFINFIPDPDNDPDNSTVLQQIQQNTQNTYEQVQNVYNEIQSSPEQDANSQAMLEALENLMAQIDELNQRIEENTNRPDPGDLIDIVPNVGNDYLNPSDSAASDGLSAITDFLSNSFLLPIILLVLSLAFVRYVLFGKVQ